MNLGRHKVSKDTLTTRRRSSLLTSDELLLNIPIDLIIEIFSRFPPKSIARCRCLSKPWASILRHPDFTDFFFTKSLTRPKLLFACRKRDKKEVIFFSTPQPQNNVSLIADSHHVSFSFEHVSRIYSSVNGYLCISSYRTFEGTKTSELVSVICNPSTKQSFTLPEVKTRKGTSMRRFLGYDLVEKQYKVLSVTILDDNSVVGHQVLTLGTRNMTWRLIECDIPHHSSPRRGCVCINGVLYYFAMDSNVDDIIVCFDIRSEKFSFVKVLERGLPFWSLRNFQDKLALVTSNMSFLCSGLSSSLEILILQDPEKHEWSKHIFNLPPMSKDAAVAEFLIFGGVTATNEFVFSPCFSSGPYHVYYYNFVKNSITRVEIQGMGVFEKHTSVHIFLDHVEDVKLME